MRKQTIGTCYYPEHWPQGRWMIDAQMMREAGLTHVRIGEFAWSRLEPSPDVFDFDWLDRAIDILAAQGLHIVLGTPTATPPKWLVDQMPDMLAIDRDGRPRGFGSRRHYCFSHEGYLKQCRRIVARIAERYGRHEALAAWQTDNEYGCHETVLSFSAAALSGFRDWLAQKYQSPDALNRAWGNAFWSQDYRSFDEVELPNLTVTEPNPSHMLDFYRYSSSCVSRFNRAQCEIIREHSDAPISHNFMGSFTDFDHYDVSADLDIATWDSYPIGFLDRDMEDEAHKKRFLGVGDPDLQAFHHDLYRNCGAMRNGSDAGRWWVMEQQPGPVNWAPYNPAPSPGAVRLWAWEAFAHGAELVSYFRWRQPSFAQEQMHEAMLLTDGTPNEAFHVACDISAHLDRIGAVASTEKADVALIFDYESAWAWSIQPQGADFSALDTVLRWYRALRRLGQNIDIIPPKAEFLPGRKLIVAPALFEMSDAFAHALGASGAVVLAGPRTASKTHDFQIHPDLPPGPLQKLINLKIVRVESRPPFAPLAVHGHDGQIEGWREFVCADADVKTHLSDCEGHPVWLSNGQTHYCCARPDAKLADTIARHCLTQASLPVPTLPADVRMRRNGEVIFLVNYGPDSHDIGALVGAGTMLMGEQELGPRGIAAFKHAY